MIGDRANQGVYGDIYGAYINLQRMVRTDRYKMIIYPKAKKIRIFDIINDPMEMNDLADDPNYSAIKTELIGKFKQQQALMSDPLDLSTVFPQLF